MFAQIIQSVIWVQTLAMAKTHPANEFVQSAHQTLPKADEYLIGRIYYGPGEMPLVAPEQPRHGY